MLASVPNRAGNDPRDLIALYEYLGRLRVELETKLGQLDALLAAQQATLIDHETRITALETP